RRLPRPRQYLCALRVNLLRSLACRMNDGLGSRSVPRPFQRLTQSPTHCFWYFQFRDFPSAIHSIACFTRAARVSSRFASPIHSLYSRLWLGGKASNATRAFLFFASAAVSSGGTGSSARGAFFFFSTVIPSSFSFIAFFISVESSFFDGRSFTDVRRPNCLIER